MKQSIKKDFLMVFALTAMLAPLAGRAQSSGNNDAIRAAFEACISENNLQKPEPGQRPSDADRATMDACMKSKGFDHPPRPQHGQQQQQDSSSSSSSDSAS